MLVGRVPVLTVIAALAGVVLVARILGSSTIGLVVTALAAVVRAKVVSASQKKNVVTTVAMPTVTIIRVTRMTFGLATIGEVYIRGI